MDIALQPRVNYASRAARALLALRLGYTVELILLTIATAIAPAAGREPNLVIWGMLVFPLLLCLPALWRGRARPLVWLCFLILVYFAAAVTEAFVPGRLLWGVIEALVCVWIFTAGLLYARWKSRATHPANPAEAG